MTKVNFTPDDPPYKTEPELRVFLDDQFRKLQNSIDSIDETTAVGSPSGPPAQELIDLSDVSTSTPTLRNVLVANGVDWESRPLVEADISDLSPHVTFRQTFGRAVMTCS